MRWNWINSLAENGRVYRNSMWRWSCVDNSHWYYLWAYAGNQMSEGAD